MGDGVSRDSSHVDMAGALESVERQQQQQSPQPTPPTGGEEEAKKQLKKAPTCHDVQAAVVRCHYHRIVLGSMMACGLFYPRHFDGMCLSRWQRPLMVYSSLVLVLMSFNTCRVLLTSFDHTDGLSELLFHKVNIACWLSVCTINYVVHYVMSTWGGGLRRYYVKVVAVRKAFSERGICTVHEGIARVEIACLVVGWFLVLVNTAYLLYGIIKEQSVLFPTEAHFRMWNQQPPLQQQQQQQSLDANSTQVPQGTAASEASGAAAVLGGRILFGLPVFFYCAAWIWPVVYFIDVSMHANHMFGDFNKHLRSESKAGRLLANIAVYRQLHRKACKVVCIANGYFKYLLGSNMLFYLVLSMVQLYSLLWSPSLHAPDNVDLLVAFVVWLCASVFILTVECIAASVTSTRARECMEILLKLNEKREEIGNKELLEMELFVAKLNSSIGFTSMDMFVVSKEVTLTVFGAWLTYFLLIVQFNPPK